jgi:hypothetical protein
VYDSTVLFFFATFTLICLAIGAAASLTHFGKLCANLVLCWLFAIAATRSSEAYIAIIWALFSVVALGAALESMYLMVRGHVKPESH